MGLHLFTDADFSGCPRTQKSITGVPLAVMGDYTNFPVTGVSKGQSAVSISSPEAEMVAGNHGIVYELIPAADVCDRILKSDY